MSREDSFFYLGAFFLLWALSVSGGIPALLSWIFIERKYEEDGLLTRGSYCAVRARALFTAGCAVFWICTILGHALTDSSRGLLFSFWQGHPALLVVSFFAADLLLIASVVFAWQARGKGSWILWIATPFIAVASMAASYLLYMDAFWSVKPSF